MATLPQRVWTYLRLPSASAVKLAKFGECILDSIGSSSRGRPRIDCELVGDKLILWPVTDQANSKERFVL